MIEINLLPKEFRKGGGLISFDKRFLYIGVAAAIVLLAIGGITIYQKYEISTLDRLIAKARIEEDRYREDLELIDALTVVKEKILERLDAVDRLDQRRDYYVRLMQDLNYRVPEYLWLTGLTEEFRKPPKKDETAKGAKAAAQEAEAEAVPEAMETFSHAKLEGYAFNLSAVGSFLIGLMKSDYFDNIHLGRTVYERAGDQVDGYRFEITCDLNLEATETREEIEGLPEEDFSLSAHLEDY